MIREKQVIKLSPQDEERFTIYDIPEDEIQKPLAAFRRNFILSTIGYLVALVALIVCFFLLEGIWVRLLIFILGVAAVFMALSNVEMFRRHSYRLRTHCHYIMVEVTEVLPPEKETLKGNKYKKEEWTFFPVRVKDTHRTNYQSICYLKKDEYEKAKVGDVMKIQVPLSKDRKPQKK